MFLVFYKDLSLLLLLLKDHVLFLSIIQIDLIDEKVIEEKDVVVEKEEPKPRKEKVSLKEIDDRLMTIDDFLN